MGLSGPKTTFPQIETTRSQISICKDMIVGNIIGIIFGYIRDVDTLTKTIVPQLTRQLTPIDLVYVLLDTLIKDKGVFKLYNVLSNYNNYITQLYGDKKCTDKITIPGEFYIRQASRNEIRNIDINNAVIPDDDKVPKYTIKKRDGTFFVGNDEYIIKDLTNLEKVENVPFMFVNKNDDTKISYKNIVCLGKDPMNNRDKYDNDDNNVYVILPGNDNSSFIWNQNLVCDNLKNLKTIVDQNPSISTYDAIAIIPPTNDIAYNQSLDRSVVLAVNGSMWAMMYPNKMGQIFREVYISASTDTLITTRSPVAQDVSGILALIMMMASTRSIESEQGTFKRVRTIIDYVRKYYAKESDCKVIMKRVLNGYRPIGNDPHLAIYTLEKCLYELLYFTDKYTHNPALGLLKVQDMLTKSMKTIHKTKYVEGNTINMAVLMSLLCAFYTSNQKSIIPIKWKECAIQNIQPPNRLVDHENLVELLYENISGSKSKSRVQRELYDYYVDRPMRIQEPQKKYRMTRDGYTKLPF
jgi:hypothetical protein